MTATTTATSEPTAEECHVCHARLVRRFERVIDPQTKTVFGILTCAACGLGHSVPRPRDIGSFYGEVYYGERHGFTKRYCLWRRMRLLEYASRGSSSRRLLDVGCGDGSFLDSARARGFEVVGTELGQNADRARSLGIHVAADLDAARDSGPYDVITMWHSLEHFYEPKETVEKARQLLAKGGTLLVSVPDAGGLQARLFGPYWFHLDVPRHLFHFTQKSLAMMLKQSGFRVDEWRHQELELDLFGWVQSALNAVLPTPNALFHLLTGKPSGAATWEALVSYASSAALVPLSLPATALGVLSEKGGTLVAFARRNDDP